MIKAVLSVQLPDNYGLMTDYILAATDESVVYLICNGIVALTLPTPHSISTVIILSELIYVCREISLSNQFNSCHFSFH